jgi:FtsZ-interacting cell division protein ZipA
MKKPTLLRVLSIVGVLLIVAGISVLVFMLQTNKKDTAKQPASAPVVPVQSAEELKAAQTSADEYQKVQASTVGNKKDYANTIALSYAYASNPKNDYQTRLDTYRVCIQAAYTASNNEKKELCYKEATALVASVTETDAFKKDWQKELDSVYSGTILTTDSSSDDVQ